MGCMTHFIINRLLGKEADIRNQGLRTAAASYAGFIGIGVNLLLTAAKLFVGLASGSVSVIADALNNLSDAAGSVISVVGTRLAEKPADEEHPFGHGRIEYLAALILSFLILYMGVNLLSTSFTRISDPQPLHFSISSLVILLFSIAAKLWLSYFDRLLGDRIHSEVLLAAAVDARSDVVATGATVVSLLIFLLTNVNADGFIGLIVSVFVLKSGLDILRDTLKSIIGGTIDPVLGRELCTYIESFPGVLGTHDLLIHSYGPTTDFASVHVEVDEDTCFAEVHLLMDQIEKAVLGRFRLQLVTHADPVNLHDPRVQMVREELAAVIAEQKDPHLSFHDVRIVQASGGRSTVVFDLVMPWRYSTEESRALIQRIRTRVTARHLDWDCVVTIDHSFEETSVKEKS